MDEMYTKLNYYLNEMCNYLKGKDFFFLDNINNIALLNDKLNNLIYEYNLDYEVKKNNLTFLDVYNLAREIIASIDETYLPIYDKLITSGELDFGYEGEYDISCFQTKITENNTQKLINIARKFSYQDVVTLVHEFIHYISYQENNIIEYYLCEFLAIYFETYAINYGKTNNLHGIQVALGTVAVLKLIGLDQKPVIDYLKRFKILKRDSDRIYRYEVIFLVYTTFGNLSDTSYTLLKQFYMNMSKDYFEKECKNFYKILEVIKEKHKDELQDNPKLLGEILSEEFIAADYRYVLGTILAIYVLEYGNMKDMVYLNNNLDKYQDKSLMEVCASIGVDLDDPEFNNKALNALDNYLKSLGVSKTR